MARKRSLRLLRDSLQRQAGVIDDGHVALGAWITAPLDQSNITHFPLYFSKFSHSIVEHGASESRKIPRQPNRMYISFVNEHEENGKTWLHRHKFAWSVAYRLPAWDV